MSKYKTPAQLKIYKGQLRYSIYKLIVAGKSHEDIYENLSSKGEFSNQSKNRALDYISYCQVQMYKD